MADVHCSHCAEPWEVQYLRHDSIGSWESYQEDELDPLEPVAVIVDYLGRYGGDLGKQLPQRLAAIARHPYAKRYNQPLTVPNLFDFWHNCPNDDKSLMSAAKRIVEEAVYRAVLSGKGCPSESCGFHHDGPGPHRETTLQEVVMGGITDDDPVIFMQADE